MKNSIKHNLVSPMLILFLLVFSHLAIASQNRIALVVGNADYRNMAPLKNPVNDANDMAAKLENFGFKVEKLINANYKNMSRAINRFGNKLKQDDTVGLFFFAGHGLQYEKSNFLVPIGADISDASDIEFEAVDAGRVLSKMDYADNGLNIMILDACRNNPIKGNHRSGSRGLKLMRPASGALVLYATEPGSVAADGKGNNGLFTEKLMKAMDKKGVKIEDVFKQTAIAVSKETNRKQTPWSEGVILGEFYFHDNLLNVPLVNNNQSTTQPKVNFEQGLWNEVKDSGTLEMYKAYIESYPNGHYAKIARIKLKQLESQPAKNQIARTKPVKNIQVCNDHLGANRLTSGKEGNALDCFNSILSKKPNHSDALMGLEHIANKYSAWTKKKFDGGDFIQGAILLQKLKSVNAEHKDIALLEKKLLEAQNFQETKKKELQAYRDFEFVKVPAGCFKMGSYTDEYEDNETTKACITSDFFMGKYEVTQEQWSKIMGRNPSTFQKGGTHPVENVTWEDVQSFIAKLNAKTGLNYRLPTEAEWEYACRGAGQRQKFCGDESARRVAWHGEEWDKGHFPIGKKRANRLGLHDMSGNVSEWVADWYDRKYYDRSELKDPTGPSHGTHVSVRGGSWFEEQTPSQFRQMAKPDSSSSGIGFRLARQL